MSNAQRQENDKAHEVRDPARFELAGWKFGGLILKGVVSLAHLVVFDLERLRWSCKLSFCEVAR